MSLGRQKARQESFWVARQEMPKSPGNPFYERLNALLRKAGFDAFVEDLCAPFYAKKLGRPSIPPGRYFRMLLLGYFEGIDSERGICWRCEDSLSVREFVGLEPTDSAPEHSSMTRIRQRLPLETHHAVFEHLHKLLAKHKLFSGKFLGIDSSTMEAKASLKAIVRRDTGENYQEMLKRLAKESGIETPTAEQLIALDKKRQGKTLSNKEWVSQTDEDARIAKLKDGRTHMAYKPEHVVDLETGAIVSVSVHRADCGDTKTIEASLERAQSKLVAVLGSDAPSAEHPAEAIADKGYHSRAVLKALPAHFRSRISEPERAGTLRWHGDSEARDAVYRNRARLGSCKGKALMRARAERVERSFAHCLDRGGMRRVWLRGEANIEKRYIIHVAGFNLGLLMRALFGVGTPKGWKKSACGLFFGLFAGRRGRFLVIGVTLCDNRPVCPLLVLITLPL